jgi:hypothetical protein
VGRSIFYAVFITKSLTGIGCIFVAKTFSKSVVAAPLGEPPRPGLQSFFSGLANHDRDDRLLLKAKNFFTTIKRSSLGRSRFGCRVADVCGAKRPQWATCAL